MMNLATRAANAGYQAVRRMAMRSIAFDLYHYWRFRRHPIAYRGVYRNFKEAEAHIPAKMPSQYNSPTVHNYSSVAALVGRDLDKLDEKDLPVLRWLQPLIAGARLILDFGGNVGVSYYGFRTQLEFPPQLTWLVCEVPEIVKAGEKLANERESPGLRFTSNLEDGDGADILLTFGTLQYIESPFADMLAPLKTKPHHLIVNSVPLYEGPTFVTVQNAGWVWTPYKIQNRREFVASIEALGYETVDSWRRPRRCVIPFHRDRRVDSYDGFYFRWKNAGSPAPILTSAPGL